MLPIAYGLAPLHIPTFFYLDLIARGVPRPRPEYHNEPVSIVIPCHNEEAVIGNTIRTILDDKELNREIIVVDDGSSDKTVEVASSFSEVRVIRKRDGGRGKWDALNCGMAAATNDIVCVLDADSRPEPKSIQRLIPYLSDAKVAAACGIVRVRNSDMNWITRLVSLEFAVANYLQRKKSMIRSYTPWMPGTITVIKRDLAKFPPSLVEDAELSAQLVEQGYEIIVDGNSSDSELAPTTLKAYLKQRTRWAKGNWSMLKYWRSSRVLLNTLLVLFEKIQPALAFLSWILFAFSIYHGWYLLEFILTNLWILSAGTLTWLYIRATQLYGLKVRKTVILSYLLLGSLLYLIVWVRSLFPLKGWQKTVRYTDFD